MKRFQFPLQKVLEYDTRVEKNESDILHALQAEYLRLTEKRDEMQAAYDRATEQYQRDCARGQTASRAVLTGAYINDQHQQILVVLQQMREQMARIDKQRERLIAATQDKTMLEKLKGKAWETYLAAERKSDELFIAELVSNRAAQSNG